MKNICQRISYAYEDVWNMMLHLVWSSYLADVSEQIREDDTVVSGQDTLDSLDWCLGQLEQLKTYKRVANMAEDKFKMMLDHELSLFSRSSESGLAISKHITDTYYGRI